MKAILEFNLPEEQEEHRLALDGPKWSIVVDSILGYIRTQLKYNDEGLTPKEIEQLERIRELIVNEIEDLNLPR